MRSVAVLVSSCFLLVAGCGAGDGACGAACNAGKQACAPLATDLTAHGALAAAQPLAAGVLSGTPKWAGAFAGVKITRQGTPSQDPDSEIFGTKLYTGGWVLKFCAGMEEVVFGAGPPTSSIEKGCNTIDCNQLTAQAAPAVDAPQAIAAAFPSDPADTLYQVDFNPLAFQKRVWRVTRRPNGPSVEVDADTGAVAP
jgi:hypothetical protein